MKYGQVNDDGLKKKILKIVLVRLTELQTASSAPSKPTTSELSTVDSKSLRKFNLEELKQYNGKEGNPAYFAFEGKIYDATDSGLWLGGEHMSAHKAGEDLTEAIKSAPHGKEVLGTMKQVGVLV